MPSPITAFLSAKGYTPMKLFGMSHYAPAVSMPSGRPRQVLAFLALAVLGALLFDVLAYGLTGGGGVVLGGLQHHYGMHPASMTDSVESDGGLWWGPAPAVSQPCVSKPVVEGTIEEESGWKKGVHGDLSLKELREMVGRTKGYYVRDWSLALGWNNMRYIIECALIHARLLNRTLVLPSFVYSRHCEYEQKVCAAYATMVNRGQAVGTGDWFDLPPEEQNGWRIPIEIMLDLPHLRKTNNVVRVAEYLALHGLNTSLENSNGAWNREVYHRLSPGTPEETRVSFAMIAMDDYDPHPAAIVDTWPDTTLKNLTSLREAAATLSRKRSELRSYQIRDGEYYSSGPLPKRDEPADSPPPDHHDHGGQPPEHKNAVDALLSTVKGHEPVLDYEYVRLALKNAGHAQVEKSDLAVQELLDEAGWQVLFTFDSSFGMEWLKSVVWPVRQVAPRSSIYGFTELHGWHEEEVLLLEGEIHVGRKPGGVRFTTPAARDSFGAMVLYELRIVPRLREIGRRIAERMTAKVGGRRWVAAHMRRGDFVHVGWSMEGSSLAAHLKRVQERLSRGREMLRGLNSTNAEPFPVLRGWLNETELMRDPPRDDDFIFIATDERDPSELSWLRSQNVTLAIDLLTLEDRREVGWPLLITDVLALVEQSAMGFSSWFYGHAMSSVAGGMVNHRAIEGMVMGTQLID